MRINSGEGVRDIEVLSDFDSGGYSRPDLGHDVPYHLLGHSSSVYVLGKGGIR